jgi:hypothetical protein
MPRLSELRRGRVLIGKNKRRRLRRRQPRFAGQSLRSAFRLAPRRPRPTQPYLGTDVKLEDLLS